MKKFSSDEIKNLFGKAWHKNEQDLNKVKIFLRQMIHVSSEPSAEDEVCIYELCKRGEVTHAISPQDIDNTGLFDYKKLTLLFDFFIEEKAVSYVSSTMFGFVNSEFYEDRSICFLNLVVNTENWSYVPVAIDHEVIECFPRCRQSLLQCLDKCFAAKQWCGVRSILNVFNLSVLEIQT